MNGLKKEQHSIGVISPSKGLLQLFPNRVQNGIEYLNKNNFNVIFMTNAKKQVSYISSSSEDRVGDLHDAFIDPQIDIIMSAIGGYNSIHLLDKIDYRIIKDNPKIFCGYSDNTALLLSIYSKTGMTVYHGPCFLSEVSEYPKPFDYTWQNFIRVISKDSVEYVSPSKFTREFYDWMLQEEKMYERRLDEVAEWECVKSGSANGVLIGGNLSTILTILGTEYLPIEKFKDAILFIEENSCSLAYFDALMYALKYNKIFELISGLIIGRFNSLADSDIRTLEDVILEVTDGHTYPIITNVDIGHTDPMLTLPIGKIAYIECSENSDIKFGII